MDAAWGKTLITAASNQNNSSKCCLVHRIGHKRTTRSWTTQELDTVTKTKYLTDLLIVQEMSTNPSPTPLRSNALDYFAGTNWKVARRPAQLPRMAQGNLASTPAWKQMRDLLLSGKHLQGFKSYWSTFLSTTHRALIFFFLILKARATPNKNLTDQV